MNDPIDRLKEFYEACDGANPTRPLPDFRCEPALRARLLLRKAALLVGPLAAGGCLGLLMLFVGASLESGEGAPGLKPLFEQRLKAAGLSLDVAYPSLPPERSRTELPRWNA